MAFLTSCGWQIEGHRFRLGHHDVDVVARRGPLVAFVEVKARGSMLRARLGRTSSSGRTSQSPLEQRSSPT